MLGKYVFSYQVGIKGDKELLYIPFEIFGIVEEIQIDNICKTLYNQPYKQKVNIKYSTANSIENLENLISEL